MIDKPMHRRRAMVSAGPVQTSPWKFWLLPAMLFAMAVFIGFTFYTLPTTMGAFLFALLVVGLVLQAVGTHHTVMVDRDSGPSSQDSSDPSQRPIQDRRWDQRREEAAAKKRQLTKLRSVMVWPAVLIVAATGAAARISHHTSENLNPIAMTVDSVAHFCFLASLTLWVFYPRRGHPALLGFGLLLMMTSVTAGGVSHSINGQLVAALGTVFAFAFASDHILGQWQSRQWQSKRSVRQKTGKRSGDATELPLSTVSLDTSSGRSPVLYSVLALSILLMSTSAAGHMANRIVPGLQLDIFDRLSQSLEAVTANTMIGGSRYVRGSKLGAIRRHMLGDPSDPAVKAYAESAPGYLRGTIFDLYRRGRWAVVTPRMLNPGDDPSAIYSREAEMEMSGQVELQEKAGVPLSRFIVRKNSGQEIADEDLVGTIEVHNVPMKGRLLFTSLSTRWIEGSTFGATTLSHHDTVVKGVDTLEPYVLGISNDTPQEKLTPLRRRIMLTLPQGMREELGPITNSICGDRLTARSKARALEDYFQENFSYSLNATPSPGDQDPLVNFLKTEHPAHCEYFASAAAMMLRTEGVPTRYVTGYVVGERSEDGKYWLARNRDAHAWVEAYDDITEQWFPVEATVGRTYRTLTDQATTIDDTDGSLGDYLDDSDDEGFFATIFGWLLSVRATDSLSVIFRFAQLPLFCLVVTLIWIRHRQKLRSGIDPMEFESRQMLQRVDRRLRKYSLVRARGETLHQFATRVESASDGQSSSPKDPDSIRFLQDAAQWYRSFAAARYRGLMPTPMS